MSNDVKVTQEDERLMQEFYLSDYFDPKAARPADIVAAAIAFARHQSQREDVLEAGDIEWLRKELFGAKLLALHQSQKRIERILAALTTPAPAPEREAVPSPMARCTNCGQMHIEHDRAGDTYICSGTTGVRFQAALTAPAPAVSRDEIVLEERDRQLTVLLTEMVSAVAESGIQPLPFLKETCEKALAALTAPVDEIAAERERCARIAQSYEEGLGAPGCINRSRPADAYLTGVADASAAITDAIRNGEET